jgi:hypothetical protein
MARTFVYANGQYIAKNSPVVTAAPLTMAAWVNFTTVTFGNDQYIMIIGGGSDGVSFSIWMPQFSSHPSSQISASFDWVSTQSTTSVVAGTWYHLCATFTSPTSRAIYVNAGGKVTSSTSRTPPPASLIQTQIGGDVGNKSYTNGSIAFPAFWNIDLSDADVAALATGVHPIHVQPSYLRACVDMTGGNSPEPDLVSATRWTLTGAPTESANPGIFRR